MSRAGELARALVSRRWWWVTLLVLALMAMLARLGVWQLDRLAERRAANAQLIVALEASPIDLNDAWAEYASVAPDAIPEDLANRDVTLAGEYDFDEQRVLKLQNWNGQPGVHLVTPLLLAGTTEPVAVLVDRGWIPEAEYAAGRRFDDDTALQTVAGYVALTEIISRRAGEAAPASPGDEIFRVDLAALQAELSYRVLPFYVRAAPPASPDRTLPVEIAKEVDLSEGPHLGYAMQWFIFSIGLGLGYVVFVNRSLPPAKQPVAAEPGSHMSAD